MMFEKDKTYENVYLIFVDASGHSNIVRENPSDKATRAFEVLYKQLADRLNTLQKDLRCQQAVVWSWLGDGGLIAVHDDEESKAINLSIGFAKAILAPTLRHLQDEFNLIGISGEIHLRIAIHKGTIKYTEDGQQGFIHSTDINFGAHLEKVTPKDCILISKDVYLVLDKVVKKEFVSVGQYEERDVYAYSVTKDRQALQRSWYLSQGFSGMKTIQSYCQRLSEQEKANLIRNAQQEVIDFGTTLNTCSNYLFSTARPTPYKDAVHDLIQRGGQFKCYMIAPNSTGANQLSVLRGEDTNKKLTTSISRFEKYAQKHQEHGSHFGVFTYDINPNFAAMIMDPDSDSGICLYSPYFSDTSSSSGSGRERADMPHYLFGKDCPLFNIILSEINTYRNIATKIDFTSK